MRKYYILLISLLLGLSCYAQDKIEFVGDAPSVVELSERFRLVYSVNGSGRNFKTPDLKDFHVLAGPSSSTTSGYKNINGDVTKIYQMSFTYIIQPKAEGKFNIPAAKITVNDVEYESNELQIEVVKGADSNANASDKYTSDKKSNIENSELFIRLIPSRNSMYIGEHILTTVKLYSKYQSLQIADFRLPSINGFWSEVIDIPQASWKRESYKGQVYNTAILRKVVLYPQHTGKITIPEAELDVLVHVQMKSRSAFDDFFGATETVKKTTRSSKVELNIMDLPSPKPEGFDGSVGEFRLSSSIDKTDVKANDAVTLKITISGSGNLKLLKTPTVVFPADFETYEPKVVENIKNSESGQIGSKTFEYLVIPRYGGDFIIPSVEFNYFDLNTKSYKKLTSPEYKIKVEQSANTVGNQIVSGISKEDVKYLNKDIRFINTSKKRLVSFDSFVVNSLFFYLLYPVVFVLLFIAFLLRKKYLNDNRNVTIVKNRKANKMARKRLKNAESLLKKNQIEAFYDETLKALWGYLGDKLMIPVANLSKEKVAQKLMEKGVEESLINDFKEIVSTSEFARFAPAKEAQNMETTFKHSVELISNIDQKIK